MPGGLTNLKQIDSAEIVASLRESLLVLAEDLRVEFASERFLETFQVTRDETIGAPLATLGNGQWDTPALLEPLRHLVSGGAPIERHEVVHHFEHIGRRVMRLNARKTERPGNGSRRILLAIEDVTEFYDAAREADRQRRLAQGIVDTVREPLLVLDGDLKVIAASRAFYSTFRVDEATTIGNDLAELGNGQWAIPELIDLLNNIIPLHTTIEDFEVTHDFPDIGQKTIVLNARKIFREGNNSKTLLLAMEDITDRRQLEEERAAALDQANRLFEEINHRVMNSLSMIGAVISMEGRSVDDERTAAAFERIRNRVQAVGSLYQKLSMTGSVDTIRADTYLEAIVDDIVKSSNSGRTKVDLDLAIDPVVLSTAVAAPLGLIVNELATNSLKYAFAGRAEGEIGLHLKALEDRIEMTMWDDGVGIDEDARTDSGVGQRLTHAFAQQMDAKLERADGDTGARFTLSLPFVGRVDQ